MALLAALAVGGCLSEKDDTERTPPVFAGLSQITSLSDSVLLEWSPASDDATPSARLVYLVFRAEDAAAFDFARPLFTSARGELFFRDREVASGRQYRYVVRARDEAGNVDGNTIEMGGQSDLAAPAIGAIVSGTPSGIDGLTLRWSAASDDAAAASRLTYLLYRAETAGGQDFNAPLTVTAPGVLEYVDRGLDPTRTYYYVLRARDPAGRLSEASAEWQVRATPDIEPPQFAGATSASAQGEAVITIGWGAASDNRSAAAALRFQVFRASGAAAFDFSAPLATTGAGASSYIDSGLAAGTTYRYVVRARDESGNTDGNLVEVSATTAANTRDTIAPIFSGAGALSVGSDKLPSLRWSAANDDTTASGNIVYLIYRSDRSGGQNFAQPLAVTAPGQTSYADSTAAPSTRYYYVVRARDAGGNIDTNTSEVAGPVTYSGEIAGLMSGRYGCVSCHGWSAASFVAFNATYCGTGRRLVVPGNSGASHLINLLTGVNTCGKRRMPDNGQTLTTGEIATIRAWIDQGAADN